MGHWISALIVQGDLDGAAMARLGVRSLDLPFGLRMIPLSDEIVDTLAEQLDIFGEVAAIPHSNFKVVHELAELLSPGSRFALIETRYFGGNGTQAAAVYESGKTILAPAESGVINAALRLLGVERSLRRDEFDAVGLARWRSFES